MDENDLHSFFTFVRAIKKANGQLMQELNGKAAQGFLDVAQLQLYEYMNMMQFCLTSMQDILDEATT